jgi:hypothetical protein
MAISTPSSNVAREGSGNQSSIFNHRAIITPRLSARPAPDQHSISQHSISSRTALDRSAVDRRPLSIQPIRIPSVPLSTGRRATFDQHLISTHSALDQHSISTRFPNSTRSALGQHSIPENHSISAHHHPHQHPPIPPLEQHPNSTHSTPGQPEQSISISGGG